MGGGAMLPPFTSTVGGRHHPNNSLSSICEASFEESWTKCRCIEYGSSCNKILDFDEKGTKGVSYHSVFGSVPSCWEVEKAMSDLQSFMNECHALKEEMNWQNSTLNSHQSTLLQSPGHARLYDAFHMIQTEPSIQRVVFSIACDEAVWEAMLDNKAVQDLQGSLICAAKEESQNSTEKPDNASLIVKRIMDITTSKLADLFQFLGSLLSEIFSEMSESAKKEKPTSELSDLLEEKLRSSLLLSVVLLLIVVVTRNQ